MGRHRKTTIRPPALWAGALSLLLVASVGCNDERRYVGDDGRYQVALDESTPAAFMNDEASLFIVETRVELPIRDPGAAVLRDLRQAADAVDDLPFPRMPWVERGDAEVEIDFVLMSFADREVDVAVIVNGFNEFDEYMPGVSVIDEQAVPDYSQWERLFRLEPMQRIEYTIREEQLDEVAVDLATVVNGAPNPHEVVFFENHSSSDERAQPFIPEVIPGLMGVRLGLRSEQAVPILLEATVRVRDTADVLADEDERIFEVEPDEFVPAAVGDEGS